jgi:glycogen operon protein
VPDLTWYAPDLGRPNWSDPNMRTLCYQLDASEDKSDVGAERLFFILNGNPESQWVNLPTLSSSLQWHRAIDTSLAAGEDFAESGNEMLIDPSDHYIANARTVVVLLAQKPKPALTHREVDRSISTRPGES